MGAQFEHAAVAERPEQRRKKYRKRLVVAGAIGFGAWFLLSLIYLVKFHSGLSDDHGRWGQFGDYIGGLLNPVFGFAGFIILLNTLYEQRLQIEEERLRRLQENFESTLFELLHRFSEVVDDIRFEYEERVPFGPGAMHLDPLQKKKVAVQGRDAFRCMFRFGYKKEFAKIGASLEEVSRDTYVKLYKKFYVLWQHELGIYFRTLYHIFKFIDSSGLSLDHRTRYANIARAQLSAYELSAIFYNGLWGEGSAGFRPLIEKYGLLKHIKKQNVLQATDLKFGSLYPEVAFAKYSRRKEIWAGKVPSILYD